MTEVIERVEKRRLVSRLSQHQLARELGVTQGHYSKVVSLKVPLSGTLQDKMNAWLAKNPTAETLDEPSDRLRILARTIRRDCAELVRLVGRRRK